MKYTPQVQLKMIARLLWKEKSSEGVFKPKSKQVGLRLFKYFKEVDAAVFKETFSSSAAQKIVELLGWYYGEYEDLPSEVVYDQIKREHTPFKKWLKQTSGEEKQDLRNFERVLFTPPEDEDYTIAQLIEFIVHCFLSKLIREEANKLSQEGIKPSEVIVWSQKERRLFIDKLNADVLQEDSDGLYILDGPGNTDDLQLLEGLGTCFESIVLYYRGITILVSSPKSYKTAISQNIAVHLMKKGCDVLFADLENGRLKMERRFYQALLGAEKEWFYSGVYVDVTTIVKSVVKYEEDNTYAEGEKVYRIKSFKEGTKIISSGGLDKEVDQWHTKVYIYRAKVRNPEAKGDWEELDNKGGLFYDEQELYKDIFDELDKELNAISEDGGNIRLEYVKACTPAKLEKLIISLQDDDIDFFNSDRPRTIIIDWGQHLKANDKSLNYWERIRQNYQDLKDLRDSYGLHMLMIEAVKDYRKLADPNFKLRDLKIAGTENIGYDAECVVVLLATEEEQEKGYRRMVLSADRDRGGGDHMVEYIRAEYEHMRAYPIDAQSHIDNCEDFWSEKGKGESSDKSSKLKPSVGYRFSNEDLEDA